MLQNFTVSADLSGLAVAKLVARMLETAVSRVAFLPHVIRVIG